MDRVVESLDKVPESLRGLYEKAEDGKYRAKEIPGLYFESDVQGLKTNAEKLLEEKRKLAAKVGNVDPDEYARLLKAEEERERKKAESEGNYQKVLDQLNAKHQEEAAKLRAALESKDKTLADYVLTNELTRAIVAEKGLPDGLVPVMRGRVKVEQAEDGTVSLVVLKENGDPMVGASGPATLADLVKEFKLHSVFGRLFDGQMGAGGGAHQAAGAHGRHGVKNPFKKDSWNLTEQMRLLRSNPALAAKLKAEAA